MQSKCLGRTGLDVSIVGLGTAFLDIPEVNDAARTYADRSRPLNIAVDPELGAATAASGGLAIPDALWDDLEPRVRHRQVSQV